jgi:regulator of sirC expression with transglutaminase-like and TPR domain
LAEPLYIHPAEARRQFREFAARDITPDQMVRGALLIALEEFPKMDVEGYIEELDMIARKIECDEPDIFKLGHLQAEIFDKAGYRGDRETYYDVRNSYLNEVIDRKLGIPISLSIIFLHIAQKVGLRAIGVGLPGHYIVKVQFDLSEVYVDPFHEGRTMTLTEIDALLNDLSNGKVRLKSEYLRGWSPRETLMRVLANVQSGYQRAGDRRRAMSAHERLEILSSFGA